MPRYARRTRDVDAAILGSYLAGANSRRIRTTLKPLLGDRHLSKSAVSRIVTRLKVLFTKWQIRDLCGERYAVLFLDGFHLKVRLAKRVVAVPVLAALGVLENGQKRLIALQLAASEATASWSGLLSDLQRRGLPKPLLVVTDGHAGLKKALEAWSHVRVQHCTTHKCRKSRRRVSDPRACGNETRLPPDPSCGRRARRSCRVRRVREEVDDALSVRGAIDR